MNAKEKKDFAKRLNDACDKIGVPPGRGRRTDLHNRLRRGGMVISAEGVRRWLAGETMPSMTHAGPLAVVLNESVEWLLTGVRKKMTADKEIGNTQPAPFYSRVPLISWVQAGHWGDVVDQFHPGDAEDWIPTTKKVSDHSYALRIRGDSMEPKIPNGSTIIVDPLQEPKHGDVVIVRQAMDNEAICKTLVIDGGKKYLKPENPRYGIIEMQEGAVFSGVVKQVILDL